MLLESGELYDGFCVTVKAYRRSQGQGTNWCCPMGPSATCLDCLWGLTGSFFKGYITMVMKDVKQRGHLLKVTG